MPLSETDDALAKRVTEFVGRGNCIAFVGSGASVGYLTWANLLKELMNRCGVDPTNYSASEIETKPLDIAEACKRRAADPYKQLLHEQYGGPPTSRVIAFEYLFKMPFQSYLTLNFDPLLQHEFQLQRDVGNSSSPLGRIFFFPDLPAAELKSRSLFYLHRNSSTEPHQNDSSFILAKSEFAEAYAQHGLLPALLDNVFTFNNVLFVACSLKELEIHDILGVCERTRKDAMKKFRGVEPLQAPSRLMLVPRSETAAQSAKLGGLGIEVVGYDQRDERHSGLVDVLRTAARLPEISYSYGTGFQGVAR